MAAKCLRNAIKRAKRRCKLRMAAAAWLLVLRKKPPSTRSIWVRDWLLRCQEFGAYTTLMAELKEEDRASFLNFLRITPGIFEDLVTRVSPYIKSEDTYFRKAIEPGMRVALTLRFLATGESFKSLSYLSRIGNNTIGKIVPETCAALHLVLKDDYFKCPNTTQQWELIAQEYMQLWNFPQCLGSLDRKHIHIRQPANTGSVYYNYKHSFSIILLALVDAQYKFLFCDIGSQGRCSDGGVFAESELNRALQRNTLNIPEPKILPGQDTTFPYCMIADEAFPLRENLMKPYPHRDLSVEHRIYNYRLSRARRCVENAFGILCNRFRVLLNPIYLVPDKVDSLVLACCCLHNMLRTLAPSKYVAPVEEQGTQQQVLQQVDGRRSSTQTAKKFRDQLCNFFNSPEGAVTWQANML